MENLDSDTFKSIPRGERAIALRLARTYEPQAEVRITPEVWDAMTGPAKAVAVATDVLQWLNAGRLTASAGTYLQLRDKVANLPVSAPKVNGYECKACALGALVACTVERSATLALNTLDTSNGFQNGLHKALDDAGVFSLEQALMMESAFEVSNFAQGTEYSRDVSRKCDEAVAFGKLIVESCRSLNGYYESFRSTRESQECQTRRLRAIMQNVVDNGGTFIP